MCTARHEPLSRRENQTWFEWEYDKQINKPSEQVSIDDINWLIRRHYANFINWISLSRMICRVISFANSDSRSTAFSRTFLNQRYDAAVHGLYDCTSVIVVFQQVVWIHSSLEKDKVQDTNQLASIVAFVSGHRNPRSQYQLISRHHLSAFFLKENEIALMTRVLCSQRSHWSKI